MLPHAISSGGGWDGWDRGARRQRGESYWKTWGNGQWLRQQQWDDMGWNGYEMAMDVFFTPLLLDRRDRFHGYPKFLSQSQDVSGLMWMEIQLPTLSWRLGTKPFSVIETTPFIQINNWYWLSLDLFDFPFWNRFPSEFKGVELWVRAQHGKLMRHGEPLFFMSCAHDSTRSCRFGQACCPVPNDADRRFDLSQFVWRALPFRTWHSHHFCDVGIPWYSDVC